MTHQLLHSRKHNRKAFTIVELLVALGLVIFIMSLVSTVFVLATKSFRDMKAVGDLTEQLRSSGQLIRKYLKTGHLSKNNNDFALSDVTLWTPDDPKQATQRSQYRWRSGYFRFEQNQSGVEEGTDLTDKLWKVYRADGISDHRLSMSCILPNEPLPQYFFSSIRPSIFNNLFVGTQDKYFESPFENKINRKRCEIALFLAAQDSANGDQSTTGLLSSDPNPRQLYSLHLKSWLINDTTTLSSGVPSSIPDLEGSLSGLVYPSDGGKWTFNGLDKVSDKENRMSSNFFSKTISTRFDLGKAYSTLLPDSSQNPLNRSSIVLRNVISFEVRLLRKNGAEYNEPPGAYVFDTDIQAALTDTGADSSVMISAVKIIIRVYDPNNEITRQLTIIEPL